MRRSLAILLTGGLLLLASLSIAGGVSAATTVGPTTTCSNGSPNTPGLGLICQVTVVNRITSHGGTATIVVRECHGAAGAPTASCRVTTWNLSRLVTKVTQCNDALNGGGATVRCSVRVTNDFVNMSTGATAATVNQCVGSGSITIGCDPFPATTTGATITQCNGSANGGTLVQLKCTASGTKPSSHGVTINQCNGSANGGGALVICSASIRNVRVSATTTGGGSTPTGTGSTPTGPPSDASAAPLGDQGSGSSPVIPIGFFLASVMVVASGWTLRTLRRR
ncbi:MAG: hypothetical protein QOC97_579 [Chloroflexota bacterium]|jgi:hypothetical protein|nr:hypothetical protein [Chloroflexota bacterium]